MRVWSATSVGEGAPHGVGDGDAMVGARLTPDVVVADFHRPRHVDAVRDECADEAVNVEGSFTRGYAGAQAVLHVLVDIGSVWATVWAVIHLNAHDPVTGDRLDLFEIIRAASVMPDVDTEAAVVAASSIDDTHAIAGVEDVRDRQELEAHNKAMLRSPIAESAECFAALFDRAAVGADRLHVSAAETVGHLPCGRLHIQVLIGVHCTGCPTAEHLDLTQRQVVLGEQVCVDVDVCVCCSGPCF